MCVLAACSASSKKELDVDIALDYCNNQVHRTLKEQMDKNGNIDYTMMPRNIIDSLNT